MNGKGKYTWPDGAVYDGDWKDDIKNGEGKSTYPDGIVYEGDFKDDKKNGMGKDELCDDNVILSTMLFA
jgi:hypothetical protein